MKNNQKTYQTSTQEPQVDYKSRNTLSHYKNIATRILFASPATLLFSLILMNSIIQAVYMSFHDWNGIAGVPMEFVGFDNYIRVLQDHNFWRSMKNVGIWILQGTLVQMPISFILALIISKNLKGGRFYKTTFFLPVIIPLTAVGMMWSFILNPNNGVISNFMRNLVDPNFNVNFLGDPKIAIYTVVLVSAWVYVGYNMVIFNSGMTTISEEIYEAAKIDGASAWQEVLYITIPMLKETFKIYFVLMVTGSLKNFDLVFVMTNGGPNGATESPAILMYKEAFRYGNYGLGSAIATIILVLGLVFSILANRRSKEDEA